MAQYLQLVVLHLLRVSQFNLLSVLEGGFLCGILARTSSSHRFLGLRFHVLLLNCLKFLLEQLIIPQFLETMSFSPSNPGLKVVIRKTELFSF